MPPPPPLQEDTTAAATALTVYVVDYDALDDSDEEHGERRRVPVHQLQHVHPALQHVTTPREHHVTQTDANGASPLPENFKM